MTRLKNADIYNVKGSVELSFPEDTPVYTPINSGQESLCRHQEWTITVSDGQSSDSSALYAFP